MSGRNGVGLILDVAMKVKVAEVIRKSDRIKVIKLVLEACIVSFIRVYAPRIACTDDDINAF